MEECFELAEEMLIVQGGRLIQSGPPQSIVERPVNIEVARLLGVFNLLPCEIRALDPGRNTSRLRFSDFELTGPYLPGHLIGDRVSICIRPDALRAMPHIGRPGPNQMPASLLRSVDKASRIRLEFDDDIAVEVRRDEYDSHTREWLIEFPTCFRVL
jgi:ABC-type Fe3+/spermidine/putrescine transport system ATPase subunit